MPPIGKALSVVAVYRLLPDGGELGEPKPPERARRLAEALGVVVVHRVEGSDLVEPLR
jgi:hypothetical protein